MSKSIIKTSIKGHQNLKGSTLPVIDENNQDSLYEDVLYNKTYQAEHDNVFKELKKVQKRPIKKIAE